MNESRTISPTKPLQSVVQQTAAPSVHPPKQRAQQPVSPHSLQEQSTYPPLAPLLAPWIETLATNTTPWEQLFADYGSPLNIHHMGPFGDNYREYTAVLNRHDLAHQLYFARKANKCRAFVQEADRLGFGVDTASYRELKECLALGCAPERLVLTAAVKEERLVRLAIAHGVPIMLDNEDECRLVNRVAGELGQAAIVGVRISGFTHAGEQLYSRFGFDLSQLMRLVARRMGRGKEFPWLRYRGLHFHLNGYSRQERGAALVQTIRCADLLQSHGITTHFIDMGGGFLVRYLAHHAQWETFMTELKRAVRGERPPITFQNNGLGLTLVDGDLHGEPLVYPYYNETPRAIFLEEVLTHADEHGQTVAQLLREREIELRLEPGRSLLDQAGVTAAQVAFRKWDSNGELLVGLEMNRTQMFSSSADFLLDPLVVSLETNHAEPQNETGPVAAYFVGAYCLEQELLLKRKIQLDRVPAIGDVICFPNTAGYMMHFFESEAHLFELATNLIAKEKQSGGEGSAHASFTFVKD